jgi:hypothetical protein
MLDTIGVTLAGVTEPASRIVRTTLAPADHGCVVWGTGQRSTAPDAALANGTAAHALDYDDMCFVSLAHPSAPLVPAVIASAEVALASGPGALDAYIVGFEVEARLGRVMNPRTINAAGTIRPRSGRSAPPRREPAAAGLSARPRARDRDRRIRIRPQRKLGSMVKPLHAGSPPATACSPRCSHARA